MAAVEIVSKNYHKIDFTLEDVSKELFVSYGYLCSIFKSIVGISFKEFLIDFRMRKAQELLSARKYKINEISEMVGYSNARYFTMAFKKRYGVSPSDYAKATGDE